MSNTHAGEILEIREQKQITDKFVKRQFVVDKTFTGQYGVSHNPVVFSLIQEKCGLIDQFNVGDHVVVHFDLDSRAWMKDNVHQLDKDGEKAYFLDVRAWKVEAATVAENATPQDQAPPATNEGPTEKAPPFDQGTGGGDNGPDDLPF